MVNTRQCGWKELKAYQYSYDGQRYGQAYLESSRRFLPRVRGAAMAMQAGRAKRIFWVSDAAEWIDKGIAKQLPTAIRIVDIWHAYQHVHEASRKIFGEGTAVARRWADRYCRELREYGGWSVWNSLRRVRYKDRERQEALAALLTFLKRNSDRMDYPRYERAGGPISMVQWRVFASNWAGGPIAPVGCVAGEQDRRMCPLQGDCAFIEMWKRARDAVADVYDQTTFEDLLENERMAAGRFAANYCI